MRELSADSHRDSCIDVSTMAVVTSEDDSEVSGMSPELRETLLSLVKNMGNSEFEEAADFFLAQLGTTQKGYLHQQLSRTTSVDFVSLLPAEASYLIFSQLDFHSLLACSHVNREWRRLSSNSRLWRKLWRKMGWTLSKNDLKRLITQTDPALMNIQPRAESGVTLNVDTISHASRVDIGDGGGDGWRQLFCSRLLLEKRWLKGDYVIHTLIGHEGSISCVAFGSRALVTGSEDRTARVWDLATGLVVASLEGHEEMVTSVRMFEDAEVAKVIPGLHQAAQQHAHTPIYPYDTTQPTPETRCTLVLTGSWDGTVRLWSVVLPPPNPSSHVTTPTRVHSAATCLYTFDEHRASAVTCMAYNKGRYFLTGSLDNCVRVFDLREQRLRRTLRGHTNTILCVQFDTKHIVSGSEDATLKVWDVASLTATHTLTGHTGAVTACMFNSDWLVSTSVDRSIRIWNKSDWTSARVIACAHQAAIHTLQFGLGRIVTGAGNDSIKIWDFESGHCLHTLQEHTSHINCLAYDHQVIVSGSGDNTVKIINFGNPDCEFEGIATKVPWEIRTRAKSLSGTFTTNVVSTQPLMQREPCSTASHRTEGQVRA